MDKIRDLTQQWFARERLALADSNTSEETP
jgi:hypothetical protein